MEHAIEEFENLKISALNKSKLINEYVKDVTIGPNCKVFEYKKNDYMLHSEILPKLDKVKGERKPKPHKQLTKNNIPFGKLLAEAEAQRKDELQSLIQTRLENIQAATEKLDTNLKMEWFKRQQNLIEQTRKQEDLMLQVLQEHDRKALDHLQQLQIQYQKHADERHKRNLEFQIKEKQRQQLIALMDSIHQQQQAFRSVYQDIVGILKGCNNSKSVNKILTNNSNIKSLPETMDKIKEKCKTGKVSSTDNDLARSLVEEVLKLKDVISKEVLLMNEQEQSRINNERLEKEKAAELLAAAAAATPQITLAAQEQRPPPPSYAEPNRTVVENSEQTQSDTQNVDVDYRFVSRESLRTYAELQQYLDSFETSYKQLLNDPNFKPFKFACQKAVNIPLNTISSISSQHLYDKYQRLASLLVGRNVEAGGSVVCASQHPQGIAFCTNLLARKFVLQGDLIVSSNPESAFCFAAVLVALWTIIPNFGKLILGHFQKEAPYLVPMYPPLTEGQTDQDYYRSLGYQYIDGIVEKQDKFLKRMSGTMRLYAAVMVTKLRKGQQETHPHGLSFAWNWLAEILNLEPRMDITATLLFDFLEVAGNAMQLAYGRQFHKLIIYINDVYLPRMQKIDSGGPMTRLAVLLQKIKSTGQIEPPRGRLPDGFW